MRGNRGESCWASVFYVIREKLPQKAYSGCSRQLTIGYWTANLSLAVFFFALIVAGLGRGLYDGGTFQDMMETIRPALLIFTVAGIALMCGLWLVIWHAWRLLGLIVAADSIQVQPEAA